MAIKKISQFTSGTPTASDMILFEQNGAGKSTTLANFLNSPIMKEFIGNNFQVVTGDNKWSIILNDKIVFNFAVFTVDLTSGVPYGFSINYLTPVSTCIYSDISAIPLGYGLELYKTLEGTNNTTYWKGFVEFYNTSVSGNTILLMSVGIK